MNKKITLILLLISLFFISCASAKITSIKNSEKSVLDCKGFVLYVNVSDLEFRKKMESKLKENFSKYNKNSIESLSIFPPIRDYSYEEIKSKSLEKGYDTILYISAISSEKETGYFPMYGGYIMPISSYSSLFEVDLRDFKDNEIIIHSSLNAEGDSPSEMANTIASEIVDELLEEECKELVSILDMYLKEKNPEIVIEKSSSTKYNINYLSKVGTINIKNGQLYFSFSKKFKSVNDERGIVELINLENSPSCRIITNKIEDMEYIATLINEYCEM